MGNNYHLHKYQTRPLLSTHVFFLQRRECSRDTLGDSSESALLETHAKAESQAILICLSKLLVLLPPGLGLRLAIFLFFFYFGPTVIMSRGKHGVPVSDRFRENWSLRWQIIVMSNLYIFRWQAAITSQSGHQLLCLRLPPYTQLRINFSDHSVLSSGILDI